MDIWNVVLNGHLGLISGDSVFNMYRGKTIIMLGNLFEYFDKGRLTFREVTSLDAYVNNRNLSSSGEAAG